MNKFVVDNLAGGIIMSQYFCVISSFLDRMSKMNRAWHTKVAKGAPSSSSRTKEQRLKDEERERERI